MRRKDNTGTGSGSALRLKSGGPVLQEKREDAARGTRADDPAAFPWQDVDTEGKGDERKPGRLARLMRLFSPVI